MANLCKVFCLFFGNFGTYGDQLFSALHDYFRALLQDFWKGGSYV